MGSRFPDIRRKLWNPFPSHECGATARLAKQDRICDLLEPVMRQVQTQDPEIWVRARIGQLKRELANLETKLNS
jgi:hypothetical protein